MVWRTEAGEQGLVHACMHYFNRGSGPTKRANIWANSILGSALIQQEYNRRGG